MGKRGTALGGTTGVLFRVPSRCGLDTVCGERGTCLGGLGALGKPLNLGGVGALLLSEVFGQNYGVGGGGEGGWYEWMSRGWGR